MTLEQLEDRLAPAIFTVNSVADNTIVDSFTTLREAILAANASAGADTINFNIAGAGVKTISPTSPLPTITGPTTINGYSQPGTSVNTLAVGDDAVLLIEVNGALAGATYGLAFTAGSNTVRGLVINRFAFAGIHLVTGEGNRIEGNFLGTDHTGTVDLGNGHAGVLVRTANNTIGGLSPSARNVSSGNGHQGIEIVGSGAFGNVMEGNYLGTDRSGTLDIGNVLEGVKCYNGASNNRIGGTTAAARNVISGNVDGVSLFDNANGNQVLGNYIGTDVSGVNVLGNVGVGVHIIRASNNRVGGSLAGAGNIISGWEFGVMIQEASSSGNWIQGNLIGVDVSGTLDRGNTDLGILLDRAPNTLIGGTTATARNVISGNGSAGIAIFGVTATGNTIWGNYIGTNAAGTATISNAQSGVHIASAKNEIDGNLISGNLHHGVRLNGAGASENKIRGNKIGTNAAGTATISNGLNGVYVESAKNEIDGNLISGNLRHGIQINGTAASENKIRGNFIGTDKDGNPGLGNGWGGIEFNGSSANTFTGNRVLSNGWSGVGIVGAYDNTIGGATETERNIISGNGHQGIYISGASATGNFVKGNYIGTNVAGTAAIPNAINGIFLGGGTSGNTIGGPTVAERNVIAGNLRTGVWIETNSSDNLVQGNFIGADVNGAPLGNHEWGVVINSNCDNNQVVDNLITSNGQSGITVAPDDSTGNTLSGNRVFGNGRLPIDLMNYSTVFQVTLNDLGDGDTGANNYQNFPFIAGVNTLGSDTFISGSLYSTPATTFRLEFFAADSLSPSGHRQAQYVLGALNVTTDATGLATFVFTHDGSLPGPIVTATATNLATKDTSELFNPSRPTNITLSNQTIQENAGPNALVGNLTTTDPDFGDAHFYTLVSGSGDTHNASFAIVGNQLRAVNSLNYADGATRSVRIRTTDLHGLWFEKSFIITILNRVDLAGRVFDDRDNDGVYEPGDGDVGIGGVAMQLFNEASGALIATRNTAADGSYVFEVSLGAGAYRVVSGQPAGFLDGRETAGNLGGAVDNSQDSNVIAGILAGEPGTTADAVGYLFAKIRPSQTIGLVWSDFNNDGEVNYGETAIPGALVELTGVDDRGNAVARSATTDANGVYSFIDLRPSNVNGYTIHEVQPSGYLDGMESLGTVNGQTVGDTSVNDTFAVVLPLPGSLAENYNFGERPPSDGGVTAGQTATIGFWQNQNGQDLIKSLNGGSTATQLGNWLAATFPNLYGAGANDLTGKSNTEVAAFYKALFARTAAAAAGGGPAKMDAQVLATALAVYVTNQTLAGTTATGYGFLVTENGVGTRTFNVGINGSAFGVANGSNVTVLDLLLAVNSRSRIGLLYDLDGDSDANDPLETNYRTMANNVFSGINEAGDI